MFCLTTSRFLQELINPDWYHLDFLHFPRTFVPSFTPACSKEAEEYAPRGILGSEHSFPPPTIVKVICLHNGWMVAALGSKNLQFKRSIKALLNSPVHPKAWKL